MLSRYDYRRLGPKETVIQEILQRNPITRGGAMTPTNDIVISSIDKHERWVKPLEKYLSKVTSQSVLRLRAPVDPSSVELSRSSAVKRQLLNIILGNVCF
ncbi:Protein of unknown function [Gryllus bimaculatus]|nr:Protein of unknown function [Gryllus bimaculatus]